MTNNASFNGLGMGLGNLSRLSNAKTRSISAENFSGEKGRGGMATEGTGAECARDLGQGYVIYISRSEGECWMNESMTNLAMLIFSLAFEPARSPSE